MAIERRPVGVGPADFVLGPWPAHPLGHDRIRLPVAQADGE
jgi:hypothetical protein